MKYKVDRNKGAKKASVFSDNLNERLHLENFQFSLR